MNEENLKLLGEKFIALSLMFLNFIREHGLDSTNVDMAEPYDTRNEKTSLCRTPLCHGGWLAVMFNEKARATPECRSFYRAGAHAAAKYLGFKTKRDLEYWASENPNLWGNRRGSDMFTSGGAFGERFKHFKLTTIANHYADVGQRCIEASTSHDKALVFVLVVCIYKLIGVDPAAPGGDTTAVSRPKSITECTHSITEPGHWGEPYEVERPNGEIETTADWEDECEIRTYVDVDLHHYQCTQCGKIMAYSQEYKKMSTPLENLGNKFIALSKIFMAFIEEHNLDETTVSMREGRDTRDSLTPLCKTPLCHGGWLAVILHKEDGPKHTSIDFYLNGANKAAQFLGFSDWHHMSEWAHNCPKLWGNTEGRFMFAYSEAFKDSNCPDIGNHIGSIKLSDIAKHYARVGERCIARSRTLSIRPYPILP